MELEEIKRSEIWGFNGRPVDPDAEIEDEVEEDLKDERVPHFDLRQKKMWDFYVDPHSDTYANALQSAVKAGYSDTYAHNITNQRFFRIKVRRLGMLNRAEKVLKRTLIMNTQDPDTGKEQADLLRIQVDVAKHITKTLGKDEGYSERSEVTGKDGTPIIFLPSELMDKYALTEEKKEL